MYGSDKPEQYYVVQDRAAEIIMDVENLLLDNDICAEFVSSQVSGALSMFPYVTVSFDIEGDWKHTHLFADELVKQNFDVSFCREIDEYSEDDSDYYTSTHQYSINVPID